MGSLISKEVFYLTLCLISLVSMASCASTAKRGLAFESEPNRAPPAESRSSHFQIPNSHLIKDKN
jgi:hypothetical protein